MIMSLGIKSEKTNATDERDIVHSNKVLEIFER